MQLAQTLSQRMDQRLVMTRQMIQSIEMLQLPLMDLQQNINQELSSNPWLDGAEIELTPTQEGPTPDAAPVQGQVDDDPRPATDGDDDPKLRRLEMLVKEWNDPATRQSSGSMPRGGDEDSKLEAMQNTAAPTTSLEEHLMGQLHLSKEEQRLKDLAEILIGSLGADGIFKIPIMDIFYKTDGGVRRCVIDGDDVSEDEADLALTLVQGFEPAGVGARDLKECLLLQLRRMKGDYSFEEQLISEHLDDLSHNRLPKIAKEMDVDLEDVKGGLEIIAHLNPRPGRAFGGTRPQYVVPDVVVEEIEGDLIIRINEHSLPALRISQDSLDMLRREPKDSPVREYFMNKVGSAVWLMESVIQRRNTLYKITQQIVEIQKPFFEHGPSALKPLMMQEVAERIHMHVSTVSRALAGKYIQTPQGLFPMKYFFTSGFSTADGESESNRAIMLKIQEMVKAENKDEPLSDQEIVARLRAENIDIARRTVAKYREKLNIPSSRQRKAY